jgi:hypothetical protein
VKISAATARSALLAAAGLAAAGIAAAGAAAKAPPPPPCPAASLVGAKLQVKVARHASSVVSYSDGQGVEGARRTCSYTTRGEGTVTVQLSSGAQVLAFVDAEDSATDLPTGYQNHSHVTKQIIPVFGLGNDAWAMKAVTGEPAVLSALYHTRVIVIAAPTATIGQMEALAKSTLGIPTPDEKNV